MSNPMTQLLETRTSTTRYQTDSPISDTQVEELVRCATLAPSAYNLQNWKFIAVRSDIARTKLQQIAYGQSQVGDAPVTFIVCGTLEAHKQLTETLQPSVDAGIISENLQASWVSAATMSHENNAQLQRDEAFRSASLAAMTLILAAQGMGLATGAMSGFDTELLSDTFELSPEEVPVMLITAGYPKESNWPQKRRKPLSEVMRTV
ncbi:nitroreductase family protein [Pontibacterium sp. N1Y112]|uniref:Nitroreductase family protein n=1 Tax=Pontibacterium sinense TaxID=2781979 RepID=A0A8J7FIU2_9GAMM|nr:nitroreductase family protein [Pontibacterium sinense]MBE9398573.1 nitroreductase family protein [Pontibacterium sinense]